MNTDSFIIYIKKRHLRRHCKKILKPDLTLEIMNQKGHCQNGKIKK